MLTHDFVKSNNVFSDKLTANMDSNRHCVRRVVPHKEAEFSSQSIMKAMEKFVQAVQDMDETILVPSRLMDLKVGDEGVGLKGKGREREGLSSTDLYRLYTMVNCVKNELLWSDRSCESVTPRVKTHTRRPSVASTSSAASNLSDTDSETGNENDSGIEGEPAQEKPSFIETMEDSFRRHLAGLHRSLDQMTQAAAFLTARYQHDIGGATV